ncbi:MAG TPA: AI-2E family transporter [Thermoanaerobaculia bacterium]|nr:AI-2E family transporter [Thermoanaerobaculia bacterium]
MPDQPVIETRRSIPNALRVVVLTLGVAVLLLFLWVARSLFLMVFLAIVAGLALSRATDGLEKLRVPRAAGAPLIMLVLLGALAGLLAAIAPTVREQARDLRSEVPKAFQRVEEWLGMARENALGGDAQPEQAPAGEEGQNTRQLEPQPQRQPEASGALQSMFGRQARSAGRILFSVLSSTFEAVAGIVILIFVAIYIAISPKTYYRGIMHLVPHDKRPRAEEVLGDLATTLRGWLVARLIAMVVIGAVTAGGLALLGVRGALALGLLAGVLELIPFYGPIIASIPGIAMALLESPKQAIYVGIFYLVIFQLEGSLLTPVILKKRLEIPPVLTILAVTAFGIAFGVLGMLAAEPLLAAALLVIRKLYVRDVIGDQVENGAVSGGRGARG